MKVLFTETSNRNNIMYIFISDWNIIFDINFVNKIRVPPLRGWEGAPMREALLILHLLAFPFLRPGTVAYLGRAVVFLPPWEFQVRPPPGKYKIKRKLRLKSNTWQWQRLRICLNSLLIQGEKSFSLSKRILHYTRCTMTESRLNDLALKALTPLRLSELSTEKIIEMFVQANPRKL